ncbi:HAD-IA family hydrolase [Nitrincola alkalilacustris]|uniref:HAD-IA family hydrolase n=1 Tax=Nitrincola alkalilacustris TaxID=1571224 RepID=UPI00124D108B|nr:HAD-IA family hydrolase [Nitrincola alkalilacustris]
MMTLQSALFDLDGTLLDTAPDFHQVIIQLLAEEGRPAISYEAVRAEVSNGARALVSRAFNLTPEAPGFSELHQRMLELYASQLTQHSRLFDGMNNLLDWLESNHIPWGIVTNKPSLYTLPILEGLQLQSRCGSVICPDHVSKTKPDPEGLLMACRELNAEPGRSVYIGDHRRDIEAGQAAGMITIAAAYGYIDPRDPVTDWNSHHTAADAHEILSLLQSIHEHTSPA